MGLQALATSTSTSTSTSQHPFGHSLLDGLSYTQWCAPLAQDLPLFSRRADWRKLLSCAISTAALAYFSAPLQGPLRPAIPPTVLYNTEIPRGCKPSSYLLLRPPTVCARLPDLSPPAVSFILNQLFFEQVNRRKQRERSDESIDVGGKVSRPLIVRFDSEVEKTDGKQAIKQAAR